MATAACSIYSLFITSIIATLLGITLLILAIVFQYIGFINSSFSQTLCTDTYMVAKYISLPYRLQTAFVGICVGLFMNILSLILIILTVKSLKDFLNQQNPQKNQQQLCDNVLSKSKYAIIYVLISFGTLGSIVCFGRYLQFKIDSLKDVTNCAYSYNQTNLLILIIIAGVWLISYILIQIFLLKIKSHYVQDQTQQNTKNKYKQMVNLTQQPQEIQNSLQKTGKNSRGDNNLRNQNEPVRYNQFLDQLNQKKGRSNNNNNSNNINRNNQRQSSHLRVPYNNSLPSNIRTQTQNNLRNQPQTPSLRNNNLDQRNQFNKINIPRSKGYIQQQQRKQQQKNNYYIPKPQQRQTYKQYKQRQLNQADQIKRQQLQKSNQPKISHFSSSQNNINNDNQGTDRIGSLSNKVYTGSNLKNKNNFNTAQQGHIGQRYNNNNTPINDINSRVTDSRYHQEDQQENYKKFQRSPPRFSPQKTYNNSILNNSPPRRDQGVISRQSYRDDDQNTRGQLIFYKKAMDDNRRNQSIVNDKSQGQVSFKSPSRFDTKFAQQQKNYHNNINNNFNSILPNNSIKQKSPQSRKRIDEKFGGSRYGQSNVSSPNQSKGRAKSRQGVLTSYIRGKFN